MHPMLTTAVKAARHAGNLMVRAMEQLESITVNEKGRNDFVSDVDCLVEQEICRMIHEVHPDHAILAEESGAQAGHADVTWVVDPIDGTTNYLRGLPQFCVSIAAKQKGRLEIGVIYDPMKQELFVASRGDGAKLNDRKIRVGDRKKLEQALLGTGFPFKNIELLPEYLKTFERIFPKSAGVRRAGSAALDLAYVACGRLDAFWEFGLHPWDTAAGALLVREAGGLVGDFSGGESYLDSGNVVAGNPALFKALLKEIAA